LRTNFRRPDFLTVDQDLLASAEIVNDTPVAYHSRRGVVLVGIERRFGPEVTAGIGLQGTKANVVPEANPNPMTASARQSVEPDARILHGPTEIATRGRS